MGVGKGSDVDEPEEHAIATMMKRREGDIHYSARTLSVASTVAQ
jgi:hypothetical protein